MRWWNAIHSICIEQFNSLSFLDFFFFWCLFFSLVYPCHHYQTLNSSDRNINYAKSSAELCDSFLPWDGAWYRFQGAAGTRLPTDCPPIDRCRTKFPGWLNVTDKPLPPEGVTEKSIKVCFKRPYHDDNNCCATEHVIHIKNCSSYFVYKLFRTPACPLRYCGTD